jgi:hypothetical protein
VDARSPSSSADVGLAVPVNRIASITRAQRGFHATGASAALLAIGLSALVVFILKAVSALPHTS